MSDDPRVAVISAGGTFGMRPSARGLEPAPVAARIVDLLRDRAAVIHSVVELEPQIDSADATPSSWQAIVEAIAALPQPVDRVLVVHGTDTMAFSASAVAFAMSGSPAGATPRHVVFTGAQRPISAPDSDGPGNLRGALDRLLSGPRRGVELHFDGVSLPATRATKTSASTPHAFAAPPSAGSRASSSDAELARELGARFTGYRDHDIPVLRMYPGISARTVGAVLRDAPAAVVQCYAFGNAPVSTPGLLDRLRSATASGTVLVAVSQSLDGTIALGTSAVSSALLDTGLVEGGDMTTEAALTKLHYLRAAGADDVRSAFGVSLANEI